MAIERNPETGRIIAKRFSLEELEAASHDQAGFCRACGAYHEGIEPDARRYTCEECGMSHVYGAEELALMGAVQ